MGDDPVNPESELCLHGNDAVIDGVRGVLEKYKQASPVYLCGCGPLWVWPAGPGGALAAALRPG